MSRFWRCGKTTWHLMRTDSPARAYCGRFPSGAWKATPDSALYPWPEFSCYSCMDVLVGNFPPEKMPVETGSRSLL